MKKIPASIDDVERSVNFDELWDEINDGSPNQDKGSFRLRVMNEYLKRPCLTMRFTVHRGDYALGLVLDMKQFAEEITKHAQEN